MGTSKKTVKKPSHDAPAAGSTTPTGDTETSGGKASAPAPELIDYAACFQRYLAQAKALPQEEVQVCKADPRVALSNVKFGLSNLPGDESLRGELPKLPLDETRGLADLARALVYAGAMVPARQASPREIEKQIAIVAPLREQMLDNAELLAKRKLLDAEVVKGIREGSGKYDMAEDGVALAALYTDNAARLAGKHPFEPGEIETLRVASTWLLENLTPTGARKPPPVDNKEAAGLRDRLWTLLQRRHRWLRVAGYYYFQEAFEEKTPRLQSRVAGAALEEAPVVPPEDNKT